MALLEPAVGRLAPEPVASADAAPGWVAGGTPEPLRSQLVELLGADRVLSRASDIVRYASDASPYRLFPKAVVVARDSGDVARCSRSRAGARSRSPSAPAARASTGRRSRTGSWSTSAATGAGSRSRTTAGGHG